MLPRMLPARLAIPVARVTRCTGRPRERRDGLQTEAVDARAPAGRHEQAVAAQLAAVVELKDVVAPVAPRSGRCLLVVVVVTVRAPGP
jgi:hypothetical protein